MFHIQIIKILLRDHFAMMHICIAPKSGTQTTKIASTTVKTVFCANFGPQICNISCRLCSNVWQKCNVAIASNVIAQSIGTCAYLQCSAIWCATCRIEMCSEYVVIVAKLHYTLAKSQNRFSAKITHKFFKLKKNLQKWRLLRCALCVQKYNRMILHRY